MTRVFCFCLSISLMVITGCGGSADQYDVVPVKGVVTCNGEPIPFAALQFTPVATEGRADGRPGRAAFAVADVAGNFSLSTYENDDGAIVGKHVVTVGISLVEDTPDDPNEGFDCYESSLEVTIDEPTDNLQLDFSAPG